MGMEADCRHNEAKAWAPGDTRPDRILRCSISRATSCTHRHAPVARGCRAAISAP